jgi:hypothetical protein
MSTRLLPNALRFRAPAGGHVESYFVRANHPTRPLALWLKATVLARADASEPVAELWAIWFDGERERVWAAKRSVLFADAEFDGSGRIELGRARFRFDAAGESCGTLERAGETLGWDLRWQAAPGPLGEPLCLLPLERMVDGPFPRSKLLTPFPLIRLRGWLELDGERIEVDDWLGMQGHNWGREHAWEYAWGQCHFCDAGGRPFCSVEGFSARIRMAGLVTPLLSGMVVRREHREYRFDRMFDWWRQHATIGELRWTLQMRGPQGEAWLEMSARPEELVCLGYHNPDGRVSHCYNSKLARVRLRVNPINEEGFSCASEHGGALELLRNEADARLPVL